MIWPSVAVTCWFRPELVFRPVALPASLGQRRHGEGVERRDNDVDKARYHAAWMVLLGDLRVYGGLVVAGCCDLGSGIQAADGAGEGAGDAGVIGAVSVCDDTRLSSPEAVCGRSASAGRAKLAKPSPRR